MDLNSPGGKMSEFFPDILAEFVAFLSRFKRWQSNSKKLRKK